MSQKIGRNDPCPCGSGKKYKHCCMNKYKRFPKKPLGDPNSIGFLTIVRSIQDFKKDPEKMNEILSRWDITTPTRPKDTWPEGWDIERIGKTSTEDIIKRLEGLNIRFSMVVFKREAQRYISSIQLAEERYLPRAKCVERYDEDFVLLAIYELWKRLLPDLINIEMIDDNISEGYEALKDERLEEAMEKWFRAWEMIKSIVPPYIKSIEELDTYMGKYLTGFLHNWCEDFETELVNAGNLVDKSYFLRKIEYCREFCERFPESDENTIANMVIGIADSYASLGETERAERLYREFIEEFPAEAVWGYAHWGDMYRFSNKHQRDYEKAREIYMLGLEKCIDDENADALTERLEHLEKAPGANIEQ